MLSEFQFLTPYSLPEALGMLAERASDVAPLAGGTNLVVDLRSGRHCPGTLVDLSRLAELRGIRRDNGDVVMGSATTITTLLSDPLVAQFGLPLREAAAVFANPLVRNRATVGGNLADASPAADTAPALLVLDAVVELTGAFGTRSVPLDGFFTGVRKSVRRSDELLTAIRWLIASPRARGGFYKLGLRKADAISVLSVAVLVETGTDGCCTRARIALGAVAPRPLRAHAAEEILVGQVLTPAVIAEAARVTAETASPIDDVRGSAAYRRRVVSVVARRLIERCSQV